MTVHSVAVQGHAIAVLDVQGHAIAVLDVQGHAIAVLDVQDHAIAVLDVHHDLYSGCDKTPCVSGLCIPYRLELWSMAEGRTIAPWPGIQLGRIPKQR